MKPKPTFTWDVVDALRATALVREPPPRPKDAFLVSEYAEKYKVSRTMAQRDINKLILKGKIEPVPGMVSVKNNKWHTATFYRPVIHDQKQVVGKRG